MPSNIAEARARGHRAELAQLVNIASGSFADVETQLEIAVELGLVEISPELEELLDCAGRKLTALRKSLRESNPAT